MSNQKQTHIYQMNSFTQGNIITEKGQSYIKCKMTKTRPNMLRQMECMISWTWNMRILDRK